jgi:hypothetical protein
MAYRDSMYRKPGFVSLYISEHDRARMVMIDHHEFQTRRAFLKRELGSLPRSFPFSVNLMQRTIDGKPFNAALPDCQRHDSIVNMYRGTTHTRIS